MPKTSLRDEAQAQGTGSTAVEIAALIHDFETTNLPAGTFHHLQHVQVAWAYLNRYPLLETLNRFSAGIRRLAAAHGADQLYHETITWAYVFLIHERQQRAGIAQGSGTDLSWKAFAQRNPDLLTWKPSILERYYRKETLSSKLARRTFVLPDRTLGQSTLTATERELGRDLPA